MKRIISLAAVSALALGIAACAPSESADNTTGEVANDAALIEPDANATDATAVDATNAGAAADATVNAADGNAGNAVEAGNASAK